MRFGFSLVREQEEEGGGGPPLKFKALPKKFLCTPLVFVEILPFRK